MMISFKGAHFVKDIILTCVRWYVAYLLNVWCEIGSCYQSIKSAKARFGRPSGSLSQMQKLCSAIFAAKRA